MKINWTKENSLGLLIGLLSPLIFLPLVLFIIAQSQHVNFEHVWHQISEFPEFRSKYLSLALIGNLLWFYLFLNREKYGYTRGIIIGMLLYAPYMIYVNVFM